MTSLPSPGQRLGRYRLEHRLGRGAMGMVFLARDTLLNIQVALKFINPAEAERELLERFKREVLLARQVTHPGICRIYDIHEESGHLFISMEYVEGRTLLSLLHERHTLPVAQATEIVRNVCRAVGAAHQHGVIHRDLKPSNIIVRGRCRISVLDFGLAKSAQLEQITGIGARVGTVAYMAPEVLAGEPSSVASDIYSTGVMLYESVAGQLPFPCTDLVALLYQVAHNRLLPVSQFNPNVAPSLEHAIERALAVKPERRFKTIDELQKALNAVLAELPEDAEGGAASGPWHGDVDESIQEALLDKRASGVLQAATSHTTVLFSDMVDIAPFFEKYGESTGVRRIQLHNRLLRPIVDKHRGKVIKCIGDAIMASFEGADDGVAAAIQMQYRLAAHNHTVTQPDDRIFVRIGLHSPATAISSSGAFGDAINVAAQASSLAGSEQVLISAATRDAMRAHRELTRLYGEVETRGGGGRHELYELLWRNATPPQGVDRDPGNPFDSPPVSATEKIDIAAARLAMPTDLAPSLPPTEQTEKYEIPDSPPEVEPCSEQTEKYAATPPAPGVEPPPQPAASQTARPPDTEAPRINIETPFDLVATVPTDDALDGVIRPAMVPVGRPPLRPTESTMPHREALAAHERSAAAHRADTPMATGESSAMALIGEDTTTATGEDTADAEAGNRWWLLGGACIAIAGAVGAWWFLTHRELERPVIGSGISSSATADAADSSAAGQADAGATVSGSIDAALAVVTADNSAAVDQSPRRDYLAVQQKRKFNDLEKDLQKKMESRSILSQDSAALDREISRAQSLRQQRKWREANEALHRAISQAETIEIDRAFVKAKLERFNKLSSNIKDGAAIRRFEPLLTAYDEAMRQGRYASANQALTKAIQLASRQ